MSVAATETEPTSKNLEQEARHLLTLLREYSAKLLRLNEDFFEILRNGKPTSSHSRVAWLLDQSVLLQKPVVDLVNRAAALQELTSLSSLTEDELELRRVETEIHLHHMIRQSGGFLIDYKKQGLADPYTRLRLAAGLNGMKGGPLRPNA